MENKNDRLKGIIAALLFLLFLFTLSIFLGFYYPDPPIPDVGVEIEMGGSGSQGGMQGQQSIPEPEARTVSQPVPVQQSYVTENRPDNPYSAPTTTPTIKPKETTEIPQPEPPKQTVNKDAMFTKKGTSGQQGSGSSSGSGSGTGSGTKTGDGSGSGVGAGSGPSFSLVGRTAKDLPKPAYTSDAQGKVVINVNVDQEGNVVDVQFNSSLSTTTDLQLRTAALKAAQKSKFSVKLDAAVVQRGTITYTFIKLN
ncbi:MAG: TonB family protein [Bacteroidales bacterium]